MSFKIVIKLKQMSLKLKIFLLKGRYILIIKDNRTDAIDFLIILLSDNIKYFNAVNYTEYHNKVYFYVHKKHKDWLTLQAL
jgi:hypothetical protein